MNNFKNFVIIVLSLIILVQAAFLIGLLSRRQALRPKEVIRKAAPVVSLKEIKPPREARVQEKEIPTVRPKEKLGKIALVIDDWGYNLKNRNFITDNDFHVTISILPFKPFSTQIAQLAFHKQKDIIIHMPMEPQNKENYGLEENTLLTSMDKKTIIRLMDEAFDCVPYAKGMSNHMGSKATQDLKLMRIVMEYLKKKNLFFLDSCVTPHSVCKNLAKKFRVGFAGRDVFIDNDSDSSSIKEQLFKLAQIAKRRGVAIGIGHDRPNTIAVLREMIPRLEEEGYQFVNLSEIVEE